MLKALRGVLEASPIRAVNKRKLQHEIDTHRLFLLTTHFAWRAENETPQSVEERIQVVTAEAKNLSFEDMRTAIAFNLEDQVSAVAEELHSALLAAGDPLCDCARALQGLATTQAVEAQQAELPAGEPGRPSRRTRGLWVTSMADLTRVLHARLGFALHVSPSGVDHPDAGAGLWLRGRALPGAVVALYPGLVYSRAHLRHMPGYPRIDVGNDYLMARYDGAILDGQAWGLGAAGPPDALGYGARTPEAGLRGWLLRSTAPGGSEEASTRELTAEALARLLSLERRNPLALGHMANHPGRDDVPNVMIAAFDYDVPGGSAAPRRRPYLPTQRFSVEPPPRQFGFPDASLEHRRGNWRDVTDAPIETVSKLLATPGGKPGVGDSRSPASMMHPDVMDAWAETMRSAGMGDNDFGAPVPSLALVALREVADEEVLLDYRLSPGLSSRPGWYFPVNTEEEDRRWA
ncbi:hypothetical protein WJX81_000079 [Elliptochloris bilobata]|uniref:Uncharacterized protein n=1 Tax=Elliptochloris bilobata TaxID=381761 RepID=A0AAW1RXF5_9CHLO